MALNKYQIFVLQHKLNWTFEIYVFEKNLKNNFQIYELLIFLDIFDNFSLFLTKSKKIVIHIISNKQIKHVIYNFYTIIYI